MQHVMQSAAGTITNRFVHCMQCTTLWLFGTPICCAVLCAVQASAPSTQRITMVVVRCWWGSTYASTQMLQCTHR